MEKFKTLCILITLGVICNYTESKKEIIAKVDYRLKLSNFKCDCDNDFIINCTCFIKPAREKAGLMTITSFIQKPLIDFIIEIRHFFKPPYGRNQQYRPSIFNLDVDW